MPRKLDQFNATDTNDFYIIRAADGRWWPGTLGRAENADSVRDWAKVYPGAKAVRVRLVEVEEN